VVGTVQCDIGSLYVARRRPTWTLPRQQIAHWSMRRPRLLVCGARDTVTRLFVRMYIDSVGR
jgi:hypothetical protein